MAAADPGVAGADVAAELLDRCLQRLGHALAAAIRPGSGLWDAVDDAPSAADHYGQLGAALALRILHPGSGQWREPLRAWLDTPPARRGHAPFNRFLLCLLEESLGDSEEALRRRLKTEREACVLRGRYPSNNWTLLAHTCRLLEAKVGEVEHRIEHLLADLDRWTTAAGGFIDFPSRGARMATPVAYHHKALFLVAVAAHRCRDPRLESRLQRMLAWSVMHRDEGGHAGGLGRSSHALYGDACLLAALTLTGVADDERRNTPEAALMRSMLRRWMRAARGDGLLPLNPAAADGQRRGWDGYMRLSVYNAWAAAILAWSRAQDRSRSASMPVDPVTCDAQAGIARVAGGGGLIALVSTRGQPPQAYSAREAELRYAGGVPFHVALGPVVLCPPGVRIDGERLRAQPAHAGWTPLFECAGVLYALTDFERSTVQEDAAGTAIVLEGAPTRLLRAEGRGAWQRALRALDWRLLDGALGRRSALHRPRLAGLHARLTLVFDREQPRLHHRLALRRDGDARVRYLNPGGHALAMPGMPLGRELSLRLGAQPRAGVRSPDGFDQVELEAAIDGVGWCLPSVVLPRGESEVGLTLCWDQDRDQDASPPSMRSSSST